MQQGGLDDLRHHGLRSGEEESGRRPADGCERGEVPWRRDAGQEQRRRRALGSGAEEVGSDHDEIARQPVAEDAAHQNEDDLRCPAGGEYVAEVGRRAR